MTRRGIAFPEGKRFAFTILDDTDDSTLENVGPVYERLRRAGMRTTKTVWPLACPEGSRLFFAADTLQRPEYLQFVRSLVADGFEIASHGATMESSPRERTAAGFAFLEQRLGVVPRLHANHGFNAENLYWGRNRLPFGWLRSLATLVSPGAYASQGHEASSPFYWGDLAERRIAYVRNYTFPDLDLLEFDPHTPYRLPSTPCVRSWFSTTDAPDAAAFRRRVTLERLARLEQRGGVCIVSTHLGKGFFRDGRLDAHFDELLTHLSAREGWYVPVSTVLDWLASQRGEGRLSFGRHVSLVLRYTLARLRA